MYSYYLRIIMKYSKIIKTDERMVKTMLENLPNEISTEPVKVKLDNNIARIKEICDGTSDLLVNRICIGGIDACLICCEGMLSTSTIAELILNPLKDIAETFENSSALFSYVYNKMLLSVDRIIISNYGELFRTLNSGFAIFVADGQSFAYAFGVQGYASRSVSEPSSEANIFGAHEGFTEIVRTNMSLLRRRLKSPLFKQELLVKGKIGHTDICICYMRDRVPGDMLRRIKASLDRIEFEAIICSGYISTFMEQESPRIFASAGTCERPDVVCAKLLEGRVAILIDGMPYAIMIPHLLAESFQTLDDYVFKPSYAVFLRWLKYLAFFVAILLPGIYVAFALWHPEQINSTLLTLLADAEKDTPFPLAAEAIGILLIYEIIREAGLRLPKGVGGSVSIVSGLIISEAAASSGLVSTPLLTTVALSVLCGFAIPDINSQITLLRITFLLSGALFGVYGISIAGAAVFCNICATECMGYPITAPITPLSTFALRDTLARVGFRKMQKRQFTVEQMKGRNLV